MRSPLDLKRSELTVGVIEAGWSTLSALESTPSGTVSRATAASDSDTWQLRPLGWKPLPTNELAQMQIAPPRDDLVLVRLPFEIPVSSADADQCRQLQMLETSIAESRKQLQLLENRHKQNVSVFARSWPLALRTDGLRPNHECAGCSMTCMPGSSRCTNSL